MEQLLFEEIRKQGKLMIEYNDPIFEKFIYNPSKYRGICFKIKESHLNFVNYLNMTSIDFEYKLINSST